MPRPSAKDPLRELIRRHERLRAHDADVALCPDASELAAYFDRKLAVRDAARWEAHFAECARCRQQLAALARIDNDAFLPSIPWWRAHRWVPGLALATVAAGIAVAVVVEQRTSREALDMVAMAERSAVHSQPEAAPAPVAKLQSPSMSGTLKRDDELLSAQAERKSLDTAAESAPNPTENALSGRGAELLKEKVAAEGKTTQRRPSLTDTGSRARSLAPAAPPAAPTNPGTSERIASAEAVGGANAPSSTVGGAMKSESERQTSQISAATAGLPGVSAISIEPPDHSVVWMIGAHGAISRYTAGGQWTAQNSNVTSDLTAGSAVSRSVCWVVGRDGTVLRTLDGVHWDKISSPTDADLVSVVGASGGRATVTAINRKQYVTTDGGKTWRLR